MTELLPAANLQSEPGFETMRALEASTQLVGAQCMPNSIITQPNFTPFRLGFATFGVVLLAVPLIAMQFTNDVNWQIGDFLVFAGMLLVLGGAIECALRFAQSHLIRASVIALSVMAFLFVWAMLATG